MSDLVITPIPLEIQADRMEPRVASNVIAKHCEVTHHAVLQLLDTHKDDLEKAFGHLAFEMRDEIRKGKGGVTSSYPTRVALLTEPQASTLITFLKNTSRVVAFKIALNKSFYELRDGRERAAYAGLFLSEIPEEWRKHFPESFFKAISSCYGLTYVKGRSPGFVGGFINSYVYEPLLAGLTDELKAKRKSHCAEKGVSESTYKLHQFLVDNCKDTLTRHISNVETLLAISRTPLDFKEHYMTRFEGKQQLALEFHAAKDRKKALKARRGS